MWKLLIDKNMKRKDLKEKAEVSQNVMARLSKNQAVTMETMEKICSVLQCDIGDVMEFIPDEIAWKWGGRNEVEFRISAEYVPVLANFGGLAEQYCYSDSNSCLMKLGMIGETIVNLIFSYDRIPLPFDNTAVVRIDTLLREGMIMWREAHNLKWHKQKWTQSLFLFRLLKNK